MHANTADLQDMTDSATVTYAGAAGTVVAWGLKLPDILAIISTLVAVGGLALQAYGMYLMHKRISNRRDDQDDDKPGPTLLERA